MPTDLMAEVAEAEAAGLKPEELNSLRGAIESSSVEGLHLAYEVADTDKAAWVPAWRLSIDHAGVERGEPTKLAKGQLGSYLAKKRPIDGGRLFTLKMPEHLAAPRVFQCFVAPNFCQAKADTKMNLIDHMEAAHPRESVHYAPQIKRLRESAQGENPALLALVDQMVATPDPSAVVVEQTVREAWDESVPEVAAPEQMLVNLPPVRCELCAWPDGAEKWIGKVPPASALRMHVMVKHKGDI